jgi:hypothetical protein
MNYEKFKRSDRPDRFRSLSTVNDFLSVVGEKFFNDYLRIGNLLFSPIMYFYWANQYTFPTRFHVINKYSLNIRKNKRVIYRWSYSPVSVKQQFLTVF